MTHTFEAMSEQQQVLFLSALAHEVTVCARDTYIAGTDDVADPPRLRVFNEMQHQISGQLRHILAQDPNRYPDDVFMRTLHAYGEELGCMNTLIRSLHRYGASAVVSA